MIPLFVFLPPGQPTLLDLEGSPHSKPTNDHEELVAMPREYQTGMGCQLDT